MQRVSRADGGQTAHKAAGSGRGEWRMHSGRWAEAAHLFRPNLASIWKMLPSGRLRAGALDVGTLSTTGRGSALADRGAEFCGTLRLRRLLSVVEPSEDVPHETPRARPEVAHALLRPKRVPAMDGCAG
eukprot:5727315-Prymnesium_polylepis.1